MKRLLALLLALFVLLALMPGAVFAEDGEIVTVATPEELRRLAENCVLDTWSAGRKVLLTGDIDLEEAEFTPIPLFSGTFDGQGHSIRGLSVTADASAVGLFRQILPGAVVENLQVSGQLLPGGEADGIGGIAGLNRGLIRNCTFSGAIAGCRRVGGICGVNGPEGQVESCAAEGTVTGQHQVGGIVGENQGQVTECVNRAAITPELVQLSVTQLPDLTEAASALVNGGVSADDVLDITDLGGVVGYSSGLLRKCMNEGTVGRLHVGYNVGGVAGRQSGAVEGCLNSGKVLGRKDVGGVVGQLDPDGEWNFSEGLPAELRAQIAGLREDLNRLTADAGSTGAAASAALTDALRALDRTDAAAEELAGKTAAWAAENLAVVNELSRRVSDGLTDLEPVTAELEALTEALPPAVQLLSEALTTLSQAVTLSRAGMEDASAALGDLASAGEDLQTAAKHLERGLARLREALGDPEKAREALGEITAALEEFSAIHTRMKEDLNELLAALDALKEALPLPGTLPDPVYAVRDDTVPVLPDEETAAAILEALRGVVSAVRDSLADVPRALAGIREGFEGLRSGGKDLLSLFDPAAFHGFLSSLESSFSALADSLEDGTAAARNGKSALEDLNAAGGDLARASALAGQGLGKLDDALQALKRAAADVRAMAGDLAGRPALRFTLPETDSESGKALFASLHDANAGLAALAAALDGRTLTADLQAVSDRLYAVTDLILNALSVSSKEERVSMEDVSARENLRSAGLVKDSESRGAVEGETNVGGVAGAVTVEFSFDQEDDFQLSSLLSGSARYLIYASLQGCSASGEVKAHRSAAGGIAGRMDYGAATECEFGGTVSAAGDYAGGIVGLSRGAVQNCRARANVSGGNYLGGIAGLGHDLRDCLVMPWLEKKTEYQGSVAGDADGEIAGNRYCESTLGGINGFSFAGRAEPVSYEELLTMSDSSVFRECQVSFRVEGETVEVLRLPYGGRIETLPDVPDKDGKAWRWDEEAFLPVRRTMTVDGRFVAPVTALATPEDPPLFLAEGVFGERQKLRAEPAPEAAAPAAEGEAAPIAYTLDVEGYSGALTVRMRESREGSLSVLNDGELQPREYRRDGSYIVFHLENGGTFVFRPETRPRLKLLLPLGIPCAAAAAAAAAGLLIRRRKKRRAGQRDQRDE